ncbi:MAG TPA: carbamoyltransferase HypF [Phnomibacter sp.]|nr:carbamoyltransferase HypF [Phnomibacter sp.]
MQHFHDTDTVFTWHIHLQGRVQGVGFRPHVYQKAISKGLKGAVSNGLDGVHIWLETSRSTAWQFAQDLMQDHPPLAVITGFCMEPANERSYDHFSIVPAEEDATPDLWIPPDFALCDTCRADLEDPDNRRYQYPFVTCTQCGPRYSVMKALPFERHLTTMQPFRFCPDCEKEFLDPGNRRFYAQTMSCPACGIQMAWCDGSGNKIFGQDEQIIGHVATALQQGAIVAVKGIGGFLLMADAGNGNTIRLLRKRKHRPTKPFAIMYPGIEVLENDTTLTDAQKQALTSLEAPIVLLPLGEKMRASLAVDDLAPGLDKIGIMLPYAPLLYMMAQAYGRPLLATSGNVSGAPICFTNEDALTSLKGIADFFLLHDRDIVAPQDDSVVSFANEDLPAIKIRRSRGYAPACEVYKTISTQSLLATGALMKSSFALAHHHRVYVSQYLGNTDSYDAQQAYRHTLQQMLLMLRMEPDTIITDAHPLYFSHQLAQEIGTDLSIPVHTVQHHKAHFAAVLGESDLLDGRVKVLGVIWDGTGLGDDGNSWGGEFFAYENNFIERIGHFDYFPYLLGDKMALEPRLSALACLHDGHADTSTIRLHFNITEWDLYKKLLDQHDGSLTSSVGRLFDAAACIISGIGIQTYEGEAAMQLEALANGWCRKNGLDIKESYLEDPMAEQHIPSAAILSGIFKDMQRNMDRGHMAAKFHATLAQLIGSVAARCDVLHICFSGGVFQNALLVNMIIHLYSKKYLLHFHKYLSPNDENISFGQIVYHDRAIG